MDQFFTIKNKAEIAEKKEREREFEKKKRALEVKRKLAEMYKYGIDPADEEFKALQREDATLPKLTQDDITLIENAESNINTTPAPEPKPDQNQKPENKEKKKAPENTQEKIENTIKHLHLENSISPEFKNLTDAQQLLVLNSLKQRIIDVVQADAQTQYSEELKNKMVGEGANAGKVKKVWVSIRNSLKGIGANITKDVDIKELENRILEELLTTEEGKNFITKEIDLLLKTNSQKQVEVNEKGNPIINFTEQLNIENPTKEETEAINRYNEAANEWRQIPYEWGQEGKKVYSGEKKILEGKNRKKYEKSKQKYEEARKEILIIKEKKEDPANKGKALHEMLQISNALELDQLTNTHPEFEKELEKLAKTAGFKEGVGFVGRFYGNMLGGKGSINNVATKLAFLSGFGLRAGTKIAIATMGLTGTIAATASSLAAAPIIGAGIGAWKGRLRGIDALNKKEKEARYGGKNKKERDTAVMTDVTHLNKRLEDLIEEVEEVEKNGDKTKISKALAMLSVRIEHTQGKVEKGQVNFGDKKSLLGNQMILLENLNKAIVLVESLKEEKHERKDKDGNTIDQITTTEEINILLSRFAEQIAEKTSEEKHKFIEKQWKRGAKIGAIAGIAGYGARWLGESLGWWGNGSDMTKVNENLGIEENQNETPTNQNYSKNLNRNGEIKTNTISSIHQKQNLVDIFKKPNTQTTIDSSGIVKTTAPTGETIITKPSGEVTVTDTNGNTKTLEPIKIVNPDKTITIKSPDGTTVIKDTNGNTTITNPEGNKTVTIKTDSTQNETGTENNSGKTENANPENKNTEIKKPDISKNTTVNTSGIEKEFSVKLGENGVPKNLETAFNTISADYLELPPDGVVDEEFAAKSLNMAANLVRLTEGQGTAGISVEEFKEAVNYENGKLEIKDPIKFNEIMNALKNRADDSWEKEILQSKGAALSYVKNISNDNWLKIAKGNGMEEIDGKETGIGQDVKGVKDFSNSDLVKKAGGPAHFDDLANKQTSPEDITGLANKQVAPAGTEDITGLADKQVAPENFVGHQEPTMGQVYGSEKIDKLNPIKADGIPLEKDLSIRDGLTTEELKEVAKIENHNIRKMFHGWDGERAWENLKGGKMKNALDIFTMKQEEMDAHPIYKPLIAHMNKLKEITGLSPYERNVFRPAESIEKYLTRATRMAYRMGKAKEIEL